MSLPWVKCSSDIYLEKFRIILNVFYPKGSVLYMYTRCVFFPILQTLERSRQEVNHLMEYVCKTLLLFVSRFIKVVKQSTSVINEAAEHSSQHYANIAEEEDTPMEMINLFLHRGFLRWVMKEYGRVLHAVAMSSSSRPSSAQFALNNQVASANLLQSARTYYLQLQPVLVSCVHSLFNVAADSNHN